MDLRITQPQAAWNGYERDNVFFASDGDGRQTGVCVLVPQLQPHLYPDRPMNIYFDLEADARSRYLLFGAAIARARVLRDSNPELRARFYTCVRPDNTIMLDFYREAGFACEDTEKKVELQADSLDGRLPMGCEIAPVPLNTAAEQTAFLQRLFANDITHVNLEYLSALLRNQHVCALALVNQGMCVGEALFSGMGSSSELIAIYTAEQARRQRLAVSLVRQCMAVLAREGVSRFTARFLSASAPQVGLANAFGAQEIETVAIFPSYHL